MRLRERFDWFPGGVLVAFPLYFVLLYAFGCPLVKNSFHDKTILQFVLVFVNSSFLFFLLFFLLFLFLFVLEDTALSGTAVVGLRNSLLFVFLLVAVFVVGIVCCGGVVVVATVHHLFYFAFIIYLLISC